MIKCYVCVCVWGGGKHDCLIYPLCRQTLSTFASYTFTGGGGGGGGGGSMVV